MQHPKTEVWNGCECSIALQVPVLFILCILEQEVGTFHEGEDCRVIEAIESESSST